MKGLLYYINRLFGKIPTRKDKTYAQKELDFFMRGRGATGRFVRRGERFRRPYKEKKKLKVGETEVIARGYRIIDKD